MNLHRHLSACDGRGGTSSTATAHRSIVSTAPGRLRDALGGIGNFDAPTWTVQLNFAYPLGTSQAEGQQGAAADHHPAADRGDGEGDRAADRDRRHRGGACDSQLARSDAGGARRRASCRRSALEAAQSKFDVGMATNFEVVQAQRDLADARNRELREQLNYQRALVDFQRVADQPAVRLSCATSE